MFVEDARYTDMIVVLQWRGRHVRLGEVTKSRLTNYKHVHLARVSYRDLTWLFGLALLVVGKLGSNLIAG